MISVLLSNPIEFFGWLLAFLLAVMAHENMHGYAALKNGDPTAKYSGRMNFNPLNHFDATGIVMCLLLGFGYAKPVPIDPRNFENYKKGMLQVSVAGVLTNLAIAFLAYPLFYLATKYLPDLLLFDELIEYFLLYLVYIDIWLAIFNLLPIYPLDGFRIVELIAPHSGFVRFMRRYSTYVMLIYIIVSIVGNRVGVNLNIVSYAGSFVFKGISLFWGLLLI